MVPAGKRQYEQNKKVFFKVSIKKVRAGGQELSGLFYVCNETQNQYPNNHT